MNWLDWEPARSESTHARPAPRSRNGFDGFDGTPNGESRKCESLRFASQNEEEVGKKSRKDACPNTTKPTEPTKLPSDGFVGSDLSQITNSISGRTDAGARTVLPDLAEMIRGHAIELWSDAAGGRLFIVADEFDAARLKERRGEVLTADELRIVVRIDDVATATEVLRWKRTFDGVLSEDHLRRPASRD